MGHLDLRISENKDPNDGKDAAPKDGSSPQPYVTAPKKDDRAEESIEKAPDVLKSDGSGRRIVR